MGPEIQGKLGLNIIGYTEQLEAARRRTAESMKATERTVGDTFGNIGRTIERKLGAPDVFKALLATLAINPEKIAEKIASAWVGGTKEGFEKAGQLYEREAQLIEEKVTSKLKGAKIREYYQGELDKATKETGRTVVGEKDDERMQRQAAARVKVLETEKKLREIDKEGEDATKKRAEAEAAMNASLLNRNDQMEQLKQDQEDIFKKLQNQNLSVKEQEDLYAKVASNTAKIYALGEEQAKEQQKLKEEEARKTREIEIEKADAGKKNKMVQDDINALYAKASALKDGDIKKQQLINEAKAKELALAKDIKAQEEKRAELTKKISDTRTQLADKKTDRSSLTLEEAARIKSFQFGQSTDAEETGRKAREIQDLEAKADRERLAGNREESMRLYGQADEARKGLGLLKSDERDPYAAISAELKEQIKQLEKLNKTTAGQRKSE